jgi:hypothetical protein
MARNDGNFGAFIRNTWMSSQSPLTDEPLRYPGQSLDEEIDNWRTEGVINYLITAGVFFVLAFMEWWGYLTHAPRRPIPFSICAVLAIGGLAWRIVYIRKKLRPLKLGRHGERVVGQYLEGFRAYGARVFHDIPGDDFNVDHVLICPQGIYAIETKTWTKPWSNARVTTREGKLSKAGFTPDRDPVVQASAAAGFLRDILETKTGHRYEVRGVVAIPGWLVDPSLQHGTVCVIDPKNFPDHVAAQPNVLSAQEVKDLAFELSRHTRSVSEVAG